MQTTSFLPTVRLRTFLATTRFPLFHEALNVAEGSFYRVEQGRGRPPFSMPHPLLYSLIALSVLRAAVV